MFIAGCTTETIISLVIAGKQVRRGIFGFTVLTRTAQGGGLTLDSVDKASDAYAQGLRAGDVLIAANGQSLNAVEDLVRLKQSLGAGDAVSLTYVRDGQSIQAQNGYPHALAGNTLLNCFCHLFGKHHHPG